MTRFFELRQGTLHKAGVAFRAISSPFDLAENVPLAHTLAITELERAYSRRLTLMRQDGYH